MAGSRGGEKVGVRRDAARTYGLNPKSTPPFSKGTSTDTKLWHVGSEQGQQTYLPLSSPNRACCRLVELVYMDL